LTALRTIASQAHLGLGDLEAFFSSDSGLQPLRRWALDLYNAPTAQTDQEMLPSRRPSFIMATGTVKLMLLYQVELLEQPEAAVDGG
jgi:hypothetical protein